ncbi:hypothetical protein EsH8_III_001488 [Colletotrichum jinshuiense]
MARLSDCPVEIIDQIFGELPSSDLAALCRVNSTLREAAEPLLFNSVDITWTEDKTPPIIQLLRSILFRPELAHRIHHLKLIGNTFKLAKHVEQKFLWIPMPKIPIVPTELNPLIAAIEGLRLPCGPSWVEQMEAGTMDAFTALLLACLPNLKSLLMEKNFTRQTQLVGNVLRSALCEGTAGALPKFEHLQVVEFFDEYCVYRQCHHPGGRVNTDDILPLFYLPELQRLEAFIDTPVPGIFDWPTSQPPLSNITSLALYNLREPALEKLLSATPALKSLRWSWYCGPPYRWQPQGRDWCQTIDLQLLATALSHVRDTLENLHITTYEDLDHNFEYQPIMMKGNFRPMASLSLKKLHLPWSFLAGFYPDRAIPLEEVVPATVENLAISDDLFDTRMCEWEEIEIAEMFPAFFESRRTTKNQLHHLYIRARSCLAEWYEKCDATFRMRELCAEYHVGLKVDYSQHPGKIYHKSGDIFDANGVQTSA